MPGDSMELSVDFRTQRAAQNAQALNAEIDKMAASTAAAARVVYTLDAAADKLAESEAKASKSADQLGEKMNKAGAAAQSAQQQFEKSGGAIKTAVDAIGKGTDNLASSVKNWVAGYAGLAGALALMNQYIQYQEKILSNQKEFANVALGRDAALEAVQANLQLGFTPAGQSRARSLVQGMADKTGLSFENAATLVSSVNAAGFHPLTRAGAASSEAVGRYAALAGLGGAQVEGLSRLISNQGIQGDPKQVQAFLGRLYQTFTKTDTTSQSAFITAAIPSLNLAREKGMGQEEALGLMSAYLSTSATPDQGAERFRMMMRMGEGATPKMAQLMARKARELGITKGGVATMADVEAMAMSEDRDKRGKVERLHDLESGLVPMEAAVTEADAKMGLLQTPAATAKREQARLNSLRMETERRTEAVRRRDERKHDIALARQSALEEIQAERDMDTFTNLTVSTKVKLLQQVFGDVKATGRSARDRNELIREFGGRPELMAATEAASGKVFLQKQREATAAALDPTASGRLADELTNRQIGTVAGAVSAEEATQRIQSREGGPGEQFAQNMLKVATASYTADQSHVGFWSMIGGRGISAEDISFREAGQKARYFRDTALDYIARLAGQMTAEEFSQYGGALDMFREDIESSRNMGSGENQINQIRIALGAVGRLRDEMIAKRRTAKGTGYAAQMGMIKPRQTSQYAAPRNIEENGGISPTENGGAIPSTQPSSPIGGGSSINYNVNVGNYFSTSGADADLTGRLEGTG